MKNKDPFKVARMAWITSLLVLVLIGVELYKGSLLGALYVLLGSLIALLFLTLICEFFIYFLGEKYRYQAGYLAVTGYGQAVGLHFVRGKLLIKALKERKTKEEALLLWSNMIEQLRQEGVKYIVAETIVDSRSVEQLGFVESNYIVSPVSACIIHFATFTAEFILRINNYPVKKRTRMVWPRRYILKL